MADTRKFVGRQLGQIVDEIMQSQGWRQGRMAQEIGATQTMVGRILKSGPSDDWENHFRIILRTLDLYEKLGLQQVRGNVASEMQRAIEATHDPQKLEELDANIEDEERALRERRTQSRSRRGKN